MHNARSQLNVALRRMVVVVSCVLKMRFRASSLSSAVRSAQVGYNSIFEVHCKWEGECSGSILNVHIGHSFA